MGFVKDYVEPEVRAYHSVSTPAKLAANTELTLLQKFLLSEINELDCTERHCWKTNAALALQFGQSERGVSGAISDLREKGIIKLSFVTVSGGTERRIEVLRRKEFGLEKREAAYSSPYENAKGDDLQIEKPKKEKKEKDKKPYGEHKNVMLADDEKQKLGSRYGETTANKAIEFLSLYKSEKPTYKTKSDYSAIVRWVVDALADRARKQSSAIDHANFGHQFDPTKYRTRSM